MTTAPHRSQYMVGVRSVFSLPASAPGHPRSVGVTALLNAVRAVAGVRDAELRTAAGGDRTLHLDLVDGADEAAVAWSVTRILDERLGVEVDQTRSVLVDDGVDEARGVPLDGPQRRVHLERLQVVTGGLDVRVDVALATTQARVVGSASGPAVERTVLRTVAGATLNAVDALLEGRARCGLDQAELTDIGSDRLAVAVVTLLTPGQVDRLAGAALVRGDARQAMVRAVLSALNRRFESLLPERASSGWAPSFPQASFPQSTPLAVENTATFRTIGAAPDGVGGDPDDAEPLLEPAAAEVTAGLPTVAEEYPPAARSGRAARRAAAAAAYADEPAQAVAEEPGSYTTSYSTMAGQAAAGYPAEQPAYSDFPPLRSAAGDSTSERPMASADGSAASDVPATGAAPQEPNGSADLGDWAEATWARLVRNDVTKGTQEQPAPVSPAATPFGSAAPFGSSAPFGSTGSFGSAGRQAVSGSTGTFGVVKPDGPVVSPTGSFPIVSSTGSFPVVGNANGRSFNRTSSLNGAGPLGLNGQVDGDPPAESAATGAGVFTPPAEPTWTPPAEPTWSWPSSGEASQTGAWKPPRWDQPGDEPRKSARDPREASHWDVSGPYSPAGPAPVTGDVSRSGDLTRDVDASRNGGGRRSGYPGPSSHSGPLALTSGAGAGNPLDPGNVGGPVGGGLGRGGLSGGVLNGGGYAPGYLEREYGGLGLPSQRGDRGDQPARGDQGPRGDQAGRGDLAGRPDAPTGPGRASGPIGPAPGWGRHGREASGPLPLLGQPTSGRSGYGQPVSGPAGFGPPTSGQPNYGQPVSGAPGYGRPTSGAPGFGQPALGPGASPGGRGPAGGGQGSAGMQPRRRHAAETGAWPIQEPPASPGSWTDPQPSGPLAPRDPAQGDRGYRNGPGPAGEYPDRRDQQPPRQRRRYADEESGRHGGGR